MPGGQFVELLFCLFRRRRSERIAKAPRAVSPKVDGSGIAAGTSKVMVSFGASSGFNVVSNARNEVGTASLSFLSNHPKFGRVPSSQPCTSETICGVEPHV